MERVFYKVITPEFLSDLYAKYLNEEKKKQEVLGNLDELSKHYKYWKKHKLK